MFNNLAPTVAAITRTVSSSISTATTVAVNANTTFLEVKAFNQDVYLRYTTAVSASNFDECIGAGETMHRIVKQGEFANISVIERNPTATVVVIQK